MIKQLIIVTLLATVGLSSCGSVRPTTSVNDIVIGMTREQVRDIMGSPRMRDLNTQEEVWEYRRYNLGEDPYIYTIVFHDGRVSSLKSRREEQPIVIIPQERNHPEIIARDYPYPPVIQRPLYPYERQRENGDFDKLIEDIKDKTFTRDQIAYIKDAAYANRFSSKQVKQIIKLFSWDKDRLEALKALAPALNDGAYLHEIIECFDFSDAKNKARQILGIAQ